MLKHNSPTATLELIYIYSFTPKSDKNRVGASRKRAGDRETGRRRSLWTLRAQEADGRTESCRDLALALRCPSAEISVSGCVAASTYRLDPAREKEREREIPGGNGRAWKKHHALPAVRPAPSLTLLKGDIKAARFNIAHIRGWSDLKMWKR